MYKESTWLSRERERRDGSASNSRGAEVLHYIRTDKTPDFPPWKKRLGNHYGNREVHLPANNMNTRKMRPVGIKVVTRYVIRESPNTSLWRRMDCSWKRLCGCPDEKEDKRKDNPDHHYLHDVPSRRNSDGDINCQNAKASGYCKCYCESSQVARVENCWNCWTWTQLRQRSKGGLLVMPWCLHEETETQWVKM